MTTLTIEACTFSLQGLRLERGMTDQPLNQPLPGQAVPGVPLSRSSEPNVTGLPDLTALPDSFVTQLADQLAARLGLNSTAPATSAATSTAHAVRGHWSLTPAPCSQPDTIPGSPLDRRTPQPDSAERSASGSEPPSQSSPATSGAGGDTVAGETAVTLRDCLERLQPLRSWSPSTAAEYRRLVESWERWHVERKQPQPDIRNIAEGDFWEFAQWRGWRPGQPRLERSWDYFGCLLKTQMPKAPGIPHGLHPDEAILRYLPNSGVPAKPALDRDEQAERQQARKKKSRRHTVDEMDRMLLAARSASWPESTGDLATPAECSALMLALLWYFGMTRDDVLLLRADAFDFEDNTLTYTREKTARYEDSAIVGPLPIPEVILPLIRKVVSAAQAVGNKQLFRVTKSQCRSATKMITPHMRRIYEAADVEPLPYCGGLGWFPGWRKTAVTLLRQHMKREWQEYLTGHSSGDVSSRHYDGPCESIRPLLNNEFPAPPALVELCESLG